MAINTNKRIAVKWVRDRAKRAYTKQLDCYICNTTANLELHHLHSVTVLLETWAAKMGYDISTDEGICAVRDEFIETHHTELYELVYTLCNPHHVALHGVYGKSPAPNTVLKQKRWIELQRDKQLTGTVKPVKSTGSFFSEFT
jgi:hypothetical protein